MFTSWILKRRARRVNLELIEANAVYARTGADQDLELVWALSEEAGDLIAQAQARSIDAVQEIITAPLSLPVR